jgi:hypothetical protein
VEFVVDRVAMEAIYSRLLLFSPVGIGVQKFFKNLGAISKF